MLFVLVRLLVIDNTTIVHIFPVTYQSILNGNILFIFNSQNLLILLPQAPLSHEVHAS